MVGKEVNIFLRTMKEEIQSTMMRKKNMHTKNLRKQERPKEIKLSGLCIGICLLRNVFATKWHTY